MGNFNLHYSVKSILAICIMISGTGRRQMMTSAYELTGNKVIVGSGMSGLWLARLLTDAGMMITICNILMSIFTMLRQSLIDNYIDSYYFLKVDFDTDIIYVNDAQIDNYILILTIILYQYSPYYDNYYLLILLHDNDYNNVLYVNID